MVDGARERAGPSFCVTTAAMLYHHSITVASHPRLHTPRWTGVDACPPPNLTMSCGRDPTDEPSFPRACVASGGSADSAPAIEPAAALCVRCKLLSPTILIRSTSYCSCVFHGAE